MATSFPLPSKARATFIPPAWMPIKERKDIVLYWADIYWQAARRFAAR